MQDQIIFEEKQYIGYNKWSILWRTVLAMFCFILYYWSENPKPVDVAMVAIPPLLWMKIRDNYFS